MIVSPAFSKSRKLLSETTRNYAQTSLATKFKFNEYFFYNRELINHKKLYKNIEFGDNYLRLFRQSSVKLHDFTLKGQVNTGCYGNCYLMKRKRKLYYFKTINSSLINSKIDMDCLSLNYIGLLRERDALLNCGGLWTPKVYSTISYNNLPIILATEVVFGWSLLDCIHVIHVGSCSRSLIYLKRNQIILKARSALLCDSVDFIEPLPETLNPIILFWIAELLVAVRFIHSQGVLHRNLRPESIIVSANGHIKITDFNLSTELYTISKATNDHKMGQNGISVINYECMNNLTELPETIILPDPFDTRKRVFSNRFSYPFKTFGCTSYAAPELHSNSSIAEYTSQCDYWSVGCIFFYMLFMINPFDVSNTNLEDSKLNMTSKSLLNRKLIEKRCMKIPSATDLLLNMLCVEIPKDRLDDNFKSSKWRPQSLEIFENMQLNNHLLELDAPFKPVVDKQLSENDIVTMSMDDDDVFYDIMNTNNDYFVSLPSSSRLNYRCLTSSQPNYYDRPSLNKIQFSTTA